jgi:serine/threonine protein kinase/tetratricopeptide (TPR) repeat protein
MGAESNQAKAIFLEAIEAHTPERWPAFVEQACAGDTAVRAEVERLLRAQAALGSFHEATRTAQPETADHRVAEAPGAVLGPYKLLRQIGEGGMGVVYMAEQESPVRRRVALKIIKPGLDTARVIARFEAERQALALMDHPNIARVLDAGATDSGRPYFVMELVQGVPITDFCDQNRLAPEARLRLFLDVCRAIQHAHHKGVIHRDIKPTNVLVTLHDGVPVVKVIDFGIAKAMALKLTERTLLTAHDQVVGTPAYMSPEQAEPSGLDIDTRSDVYALGVLLYELLTGTTPLEIERLRGAGYIELLRLIREEEAPRPSRRLSSLGESAAVLADRRSLDVRRLARALAGDLDWVVMKALEKDRDRRYGTPAGLAEDVDRYLRREAVLARPPSAIYKVKKFAQRHRPAVTAVCAVAGALLAGAAVATWQAVAATRAHQEAVAAARAERTAKELAQLRELETSAALAFLESRVLAAARPEGQAGGLGRDVTLEEAVKAALPYVETSFTNQPLIEARLRMTLGQSFGYLGEARLAADQWQTARTLYSRHLGPDDPDTLRSMFGLAQSYADLGRYADALRLREETLALQKARLGPDHPDTLRTMSSLACSYADLRRRADALKLREETLALMRARLGPDDPDTLAGMYNLAASYAAVGRQAEARRLREETLALRTARLGAEHPDTLRSMNGLAVSHAAFGRHDEAVKLYRQALALQKARLGPDHPDTIQTMYNLALSLAAEGRQAEALQLRQESLDLHRARLGADHPRTLMSRNNVASSYAAVGRYADALNLYEETLALQKARLGPDHPDTLWSLWGVAYSLVQLGRGAEALPVIDEWLRQAPLDIVAPALLRGVTELRLRHFEKASDGAGCRRTAEMWEGLNRTGADDLYHAACLRAVTAAVVRAGDRSSSGAAQSGAEADRAMAWLSQAVAAGYTDAARLKRSNDLDALRDRADFAKLLTTLESVHD